MGVSVLPTWIKEASKGTEEDLAQKTCHVDFPAMFFALVNSRSLYDTIDFQARQARLHYSQQTTSTTNISEGEPTHPHSPSLSEDIEMGSSSKHPHSSSESEGSTSKHARLASGAPSGASTPTGAEFVAIPSVPTNLMTSFQLLLQGGPVQIFLDGSGTPTTTATPNKGIVSELHFQIHLGKDQAAVRNITYTISLLWSFNRTMAS